MSIPTFVAKLCILAIASHWTANHTVDLITAIHVIIQACLDNLQG